MRHQGSRPGTADGGDHAPPSRLRAALPAGVIDAALASLATFGAALYASARFAPELLGAYALFFMAFATVAVVATQLLFIPAEVAALAYAGVGRLSVVGRSLRLAGWPTVGFGFLVALTALVAPPELAMADMRAFIASGVAATILSPIQDHVRRMLHLAGVSWAAAAVSAVQLGGVVAGIAVITALGVGQAWVPLGALAGANAVSLGFGLALVARFRDPAAVVTFRLAALVRSGRWLLLAGAAPAGAGFVASALVSAIAGAAALGYAEAARVVGQPVHVLGTGLQAVIGPRSMEAGSDGDAPKASRHARLFWALVAVPSAAYAALVGFDVVWNPAARLVPQAYFIGGLVMVTIVANVVVAAGVPSLSELIGGRREAQLAAAETVAGGVRAATGGAAAWLGSFAVPWGFFAYGLARVGLFRRARRTLYGGLRTAEPDPVGDAA